MCVLRIYITIPLTGKSVYVYTKIHIYKKDWKDVQKS